MSDAPVARPDLDALIANLNAHARHVWDFPATLMRDGAAALEAERARADQAEAVTDAKVERAARAMFELDFVLEGDWTWADVVREEPSRAEIWRDDARQVLAAVLPAAPTTEQ